MKHEGLGPTSQRRHVSIKVSLSGSDDTAAEAGASASGQRQRAKLIALVSKLLGHGMATSAQRPALASTGRRQASEHTSCQGLSRARAMDSW